MHSSKFELYKILGLVVTLYFLVYVNYTIKIVIYFFFKFIYLFLESVLGEKLEPGFDDLSSN